MQTAVFSTKSYDRQFLEPVALAAGHALTFFEPRLSLETAVLARGFPAVCAFVNDQLSTPVLEELAHHGCRAVALRCAGFNQVDLETARRLGVRVARVPAYSPHAVAEHTVGMILALNRKFHRAYNRVREGNFSLDGLLGFDLFGRTVGIIGTGQIGAVVTKILSGFGCRLLLHDVAENPACQPLGEYAPLEQLLAASDILTLHCPLTPQTRHLINAHSLSQMRPGAMLVNTSRGALVDTRAAIEALKSGRLGYLGLDVYEEESDLFFEDLSEQVIQDDVFSRLLTFPNVLVTSHQAFFTQNALEQIAAVTVSNLTGLERGEPLTTELTAPRK